MVTKKVILTICALFALLGCNDKNHKIIAPEDLKNLVYQNSFKKPAETEFGNNYEYKSAIHKKSVCFKSSDSSYVYFQKRITPKEFFSVVLWIKPKFYWRNGTIINLSKHLKDFPINSSLSLYMNKNRIAVMQEGKDLRKVGYKNHGEFTDYFMGLEKLVEGEIYFLAYIYENNKVTIFLDGKMYAAFHNVPPTTFFNYITLGASWNKKGTKYYFEGCMDDLYIYNQALSQKEIITLMDYTHVYQYAE